MQTKNIKEKAIDLPVVAPVEEEEIASDFINNFSPKIVERGIDYYYSNNVRNVYKSKNKYYAKVLGSSVCSYDVTIEIEGDKLNYNCTCPCEYPCKHEYAVLLAISNKEYSEIELKEPVRENKISQKTILKSIPSEEIKDYIISQFNQGYTSIEMSTLFNKFGKYQPSQTYEYYYNNLFNSLVLDDAYVSLTNSYLRQIKQDISINKFSEVTNIIKAIINAYSDTNKLNSDDNFIDILPKIGMYLRVTYRKSDEKIKSEITTWLNKLKEENYFDNYYLEDIVLSVKN